MRRFPPSSAPRTRNLPPVAARDATAEFFGDLAERGREPFLAKATGTLRFDLAAGESTEHWLVSVERGDVTVSREHAEADCVLSSDRTLFDGVVRGEVNPMAALLRGALTVTGRVELFILLQRLLPGPPRAAKRNA